MQRTKKNEEAAEAEGPAEGPSDEELKKEVESILDCAGDDFSMKDLLAKLRESHTLATPYHTSPAKQTACCAIHDPHLSSHLLDKQLVADLPLHAAALEASLWLVHCSCMTHG